VKVAVAYQLYSERGYEPWTTFRNGEYRRFLRNFGFRAPSLSRPQCKMIVNSMPTKLNRELIAAAIDGFEEQKRRINAQITELRQMLSGGSVSDGATPPEATTKRRRMSAAARARIAAAQRKRWAAKRAGGAGSKRTSAPVRKKRTMSAAGRKAIIEATNRRWAAVRAARKR
jgi:hypothetical protein